MDTHDPNDRDDAGTDDAELEAARKALKAHRVPREQLDPWTADLVKRADFQEGIEERKKLAKWEPPPAPKAVEIAAEGGAVLVQAEAAATYLAAVEVSQPEAPRPPSALVRLHEDIDPRKKPTERMARKALPKAAREAGAGSELGAGSEMDGAGEQPAREARSPGRAPRVQPHAAVRAEAPSSRSGAGGGERGKRRGFLVGAMIFVAGGIAVLALVRPHERGTEQAASATATVVSTVPSALTTSAARVEAPAPSVDATSAGAATGTPATSAAPSVSATSAPAVTGSGTTSSTHAPKASGDPYAEVSAPVVKGAPSAQPSAGQAVTAAPSAAPMATSAPSTKPTATVAPSTTSTSRPFAPYVPEKD